MEGSALTASAIQVLCCVVRLAKSVPMLLLSTWSLLGAAVATATTRAKMTTNEAFILKVWNEKFKWHLQQFTVCNLHFYIEYLTAWTSRRGQKGSCPPPLGRSRQAKKQYVFWIFFEINSIILSIFKLIIWFCSPYKNVFGRPCFAGIYTELDRHF